MTKKERARLVIDGLAECYPDVKCALVYEKPHELLIATRLSAQCTDKRVNMVTPALFGKFPDVDSFAAAEPDEVAEYIHSCGLYKTKAVDIVMMCRMMRDEFGGKVPDTIEQLVKLPGVGRKTANLIVGDIFGKPAVVVDTHCIRLTHRLGIHNIKDPKKIEFMLRDLLPPEESNDFCHRLVLHGRAVCDARKPKCEICCMNDFCPKNI